MLQKSILLDLLFPNPTVGFLTSLPERGVLDLHTSTLDSLLAVFAYKSPLQELIHQYKYNYTYTLAPIFAQAMYQKLIQNYPHILHYWQSNNFCLFPLPLSPTRQNWRGFNQSQELAVHLSPLLKLNISPPFVSALSHTPQARLSRLVRKTNLTHKFLLSHTPSQKQNYIILDDVTTTHTTILQISEIIEPFSHKLPWGLTLAG